jgi:polysaccharide export outer membrane protein
MEEHLKELLSHFSVDVWLANRSFSIIGDGRSQRIQIPSEKLTIFQALALSGDMSLFSDRSKIKLVRQTEAGTIVKSFDLRPKSIINSEFYYIQPNDVLYVQHTFAKYFGIEHFTTAISATLGTVSFAIIMYRIGKTVKEKTDKNKPTAE